MCKSKEIKKLFKNYSTLHPDELVLFDGIITEGHYNILFILKESNISGSTSKTGVDESFWFKEVYNVKSANPSAYYGNKLNSIEKAAQTKYFNCITQIVNDLYPNTNKDNIGISYININKNGGGNNCDNIGIKDWLETGCKHQFLLKQIETIIKPDKIVIFSCNNSNPKIQKFAEELEKLQYNVQREKYHPSRYKKK